MNFAEYVVWILLCKHCKYGEKIYYHPRDIELFLGVPFWRALYILARRVEMFHEITPTIPKVTGTHTGNLYQRSQLTTLQR